jgi:hypothetical protein
VLWRRAIGPSISKNHLLLTVTPTKAKTILNFGLASVDFDRAKSGEDSIDRGFTVWPGMASIRGLNPARRNGGDSAKS